MANQSPAQLFLKVVSVLVVAGLLAGLVLAVPAPAPARAAGEFTDLGSLGMRELGRASLALGDLDADGDLDILLSGTSGYFWVTRIYRNDAEGTFTEVVPEPIGNNTGYASWGDFDSDGDLDLAFFGYYTGTIYRNDGGTFVDIGADLSQFYGRARWGDYDSDGDLDLLPVSGQASQVCLNDGQGRFHRASTGLPDVFYSSLDWADYDGDGDLDLLAAGSDWWSGFARVYRNDGGSFTDIAAGLPGAQGGAVTWADYDADGRPDVLVTGRVDSLPVARLFRNGGGTFAEVEAGLPGVYDSSAAWGDYDHDGDLDLALAGRTATGYVAGVFRNDGGAFTDLGAGLPGVSPGAVAWGDLDGDGDLDLVLAGDGEAGPVTRVYRNDCGTANLAPTAPEGLSAEVRDFTVILSWGAAVDDHTPAAGLTYNLRVGTAPGRGDIVSPMATAGGYRLVPAPGNSGQGTSARLGPLAAGTYYWSVQAIDGAFVGGPFAAEGRFDIVSPFSEAGSLAGASEASLAWGDYDSDGDLDLLLTGYGSASTVSTIYRNDGGSLAAIEAGLPGVSRGAGAWGDYDGDGDLDILLAGNGISRVYRNDGGAFADVQAGLPGLLYGDAAWADYDSDGDLDIVLSGRAPTGEPWGGSVPLGKVYRNDGNGQFTDAGVALPVMTRMAWGDYDNDGDLDILSLRTVYRNEGNGVFTDIQAGFEPIAEGSLAWGDYDADGDLDALVAGAIDDYRYAARVYRNDGGRFSDANAGLPGVRHAKCAWGDYDNDGDLDILLAGSTTWDSSGSIARVYRNDGNGAFTDTGFDLSATLASALAWGDMDGDGDLDIAASGWYGGELLVRLYRNETANANTPPGAPSAPVATVAGSTVHLSWEAATDAQTPAPGLTYNLRVGTAPGRADVAAPMSDLVDGRRRVPQMGNAGHGTTARLEGLLAGTYYWSVQAVDSAFAGSPFTSEGSFTILPQPPSAVTIAGPAVGKVGVAVTFTATVSPRAVELPITFTWQADGQPAVTHTVESTTDTVTYTWPITGTQAVTVSASSAGVTVADTHSITLYVPPQADFAATPLKGAAPLTVSFTNLSTGDYTSSWWSFGDYGMSPEANPTHTYTWPGTFTVSLTVSGPGGSSTQTKTAYIQVLNPVQADFSATPVSGTAPLTVTFTNESTSGYTYSQWSFGDGTAYSYETNPTHVYTTKGVYDVTLTVGSPYGDAWVTKPGYITVYDPVRAGFTATPVSGTVPLAVSFTNTSTGDYTSLHWSFGDGAESTEAAPSHTYSAPGVYTATLTASGPGGTDTAQATITVVGAVEAGFSASPASGVAPLQVAFTNTSSGAFTSSLWDFGDGTTSQETSPIHTYTAKGVYTVTLAVSGLGGSDTAQATITVYAPVVAGSSASPLSGVAPLEVAFANASAGDYDTLLWDFGDGTTSSEANPAHTYAAKGVYTVTLTVSGPGGTDTEQATITVYEPVVAGLSAEPASGVAPLEVAFTNTSGGDYGWTLWDFGDGTTSSEANPAHLYAAKGVYTVTLTVGGPGGADTEQATITVYARAQAAFTAEPLAGLPPLTVAFRNASSGDYDTLLWDLGDGTTSTLPNPIHTYTALGTYTVTLTVSGPGGTSTEVKPGYIWVCEPPKARFKANPTEGAAPLVVAFTNTSTGGWTESWWDFGDGTTSRETHPVHMYTEPGRYTVTLTVSGPGGTATESEKSFIVVRKKE